jgi:hypothetical protein
MVAAAEHEAEHLGPISGELRGAKTK